MVMKQQFNNMAVEEKQIKALIILFDDLIRYRKKLLDCDLAEAILSVIPICMKNRDTFEAQLKEKTNECEQLKIHLETVQEKIAKLYSECEKDTRMKEFLDFAIFLSNFRDSCEETGTMSNDFFQGYDSVLKDDFKKESIDCIKHESKAADSLLSEEPIDEIKGSEISPIVVNEDIVSLNSSLGKAYELLNSEILRRKEAEKRRDNLEFLSEKLSCLLLKYEKLVELKETNSQTSRDLLIVEKIEENDFSIEKKHQFPLLPSSNFQDDKACVENINSEVIISERNACPSEMPHETFNLSDRENFHKFESTEEANSITVVQPFSFSIASAQSHLQSEQSNVSVTESNRNCHSSQDVSDLIHTTVAEQTSCEPLKRKRNRKSASPKTAGVNCHICGQILSTKHHLNRHIKDVHVKLKPFKCSSCSKLFSRREHLKGHNSRIHKTQ